MRFHISKVMTRNFIADFIASVQNLAGKRQRTYERMKNEGAEVCIKELDEKKLKVKWYRFEMTQLNTGAVALLLYGEGD